ncbi:hypothetical protein BKA70DRAFT_1329039 [Coprinopsis sp. MPI-PUGE-AT-0042]|nr:hypothetical protein BKA70DRAFT_1329039 [Coprinopsis sp. MPI-PUGE-AT-0042]
MSLSSLPTLFTCLRLSRSSSAPLWSCIRTLKSKQSCPSCLLPLVEGSVQFPSEFRATFASFLWSCAPRLSLVRVDPLWQNLLHN